MRFAGAGRAKCVMSETCLQHDDILAPINPFATRQLQHLHLVQGRDRLEVKTVQAFDGWEFGDLDPSFDHPLLTFDHFQCDQVGEELDMILTLCGALGRIGAHWGALAGQLPYSRNTVGSRRDLSR